MSHITTIKVQIKDLDSLSKAAKECGLLFNENQTKYRHYYGNGQCDHAIVVPNSKQAYEIGVVKNKDFYELQLDSWSGGYGLEQKAGKECSNLIDAYTKNVAITQAQQFADSNGYSLVEEFDQQTNETVLKLRRY